MKIPILKLGGILLTSLQEDLTDRDVVDLQEDLLDMVNREEVTCVVIDVMALDTIDSYLSKVISETASMVGILGCDIVISGIRPAVALTLLDLDTELVRARTALDLEQGIELLKSRG